MITFPKEPGRENWKKKGRDRKNDPVKGTLLQNRRIREEKEMQGSHTKYAGEN